MLRGLKTNYVELCRVLGEKRTEPGNLENDILTRKGQAKDKNVNTVN